MNKIICRFFLTMLVLLNAGGLARAQKIKVVTTIGMITDVAREIGGDKVEVIGLRGANSPTPGLFFTTV
jgi:ABC-type Zn uptake system ZnuABC Zn-binding protein ZnuA